LRVGEIDRGAAALHTTQRNDALFGHTSGGHKASL
jgi:hypothetical protein